MRKKKIIGMIIAFGLVVNLSTGLVVNAAESVVNDPQVEQAKDVSDENVASDEVKEEPKAEDEKKDEVVKLTYNKSTQKVREKLDLSLINAKAINVNDASTKYEIKFGVWPDTENPIGNAMNEEGVLVKPGTYNIVIQAINSKKECVAEGTTTIKIISEEKEKDQAPVITGSGAIINQYEKFDINSLGIKASDKEDGDLTSKIIINSKVDSSKAGVQSVYASVKDSSGNETKEVFSVVVKERGRPVIIGSDRLVLKVSDKFNYSMLKLTASDKEDGDLTEKITFTGKVNTSKAGVYTVTAKVSDKDKLEAVKVVTVVVEEKAQIKPVKPTKPNSKPNSTKPDTGDAGSLGFLMTGMVALAGVIGIKRK
ncbi:MAG: immunoglobulin-like domain-containing protein [Clostridium sp.]